MAALLTIGSSALADGKRIAFVGCPVMRDMELPARPCWLAQDGDKLYFVGMQGDVFPPIIFFPLQLKHQVLVEGEEGEGDTICGGLPIKNVTVSVLPEVYPACDTVLPQAGFAPGPELRPSPPFRKGQGLATDPTYSREGYARDQSFNRPPAPQPPFQARTFRVDFAFDEDFLHLDDDMIIGQAGKYFEDIKGSKLTVSVFRDRVELTNGRIIEEDMHVVQRRADRMLNIFTEWGVPTSKIETRVSHQAMPGGRYLTLTVEP